MPDLLGATLEAAPLIEARWKDLMQVALSVQAGTVLPPMLLRKLGTQSRQNQLY